MNNKKDYTDSILYTISTYIWWIFLGNIYFLIFNLPLVTLLFGLTMGIFINPAVWFISICCITIGPALTALMGVARKVVVEKDVVLTRRFFKTYKNSFIQSTIIWSGFVILLTFLFLDAQYFMAHKSAFAYLFYFIILYVLVLSLYCLSIISAFYLKTVDILKVSFGYSLMNFKTTLFNMFVCILSAYMFFQFMSYSVLFLSSIFCYVIMYNNERILVEIEKKITTVE